MKQLSKEVPSQKLSRFLVPVTVYTYGKLLKHAVLSTYKVHDQSLMEADNSIQHSILYIPTFLFQKYLGNYFSHSYSHPQYLYYSMHPKYSYFSYIFIFKVQSDGNNIRRLFIKPIMSHYLKKPFYYYFVQALMMKKNSAPSSGTMLPTMLIIGPQYGGD